MDEHDWLAEQVEAQRAHLRSVAFRMLGSASEADDAVQEAWLWLSRSDTTESRTYVDGSRNLSPAYAWTCCVVGRSPAAARQLASRARRRVQGNATVPDADFLRKREVVDAFLAASRGGDFGALLAVLDPDVVFRADRAAVQMGASSEVRGAAAVAETFSGRARFAQAALVNGAVGAIWASHGRPRVVFEFTITRGKIVCIDILADPERLQELDLAVLDD
jgi:Sigma-70 region 2